jgi:putative toxin-antitoxin system antitoxin component (TIGR02293 family)
MDKLARVSKFLGGSKVVGTPRTELDFIPLIKRGLPYSALASLKDRTGLAEGPLLSSMGIARRTAARRKHPDSRVFKPAESERLVRLARVLADAEDVLGGEAQARAWVNRPNRALGNHTPLALLDTGMGFQEVLNVLGRIEYGVFS